MTHAARERPPWREEPEPADRSPLSEAPVTCQVCGAPHQVEESIFCTRCGEPVLAVGWAP